MYARTSNPISRILLFFLFTIVITFTLALPATVLAASAIQGSGTAEDEVQLLASYESDVVTLKEGDVVIYLDFYDDDSFELYIEYEVGDDSSIAYGEYEEGDDGVLLTFMGADNEDFASPIEVELSYDDDDTLVITGTEDGLLGEVDITLYPVDLGGDDPGLDSGSRDFEIAGVYVSPVQPVEGSAGVVYLLNLLPDGSAGLNSDYLDMQPPVFELGSWTENDDGSVTVEIAGTVEEEYEEPITLEFAVDEYGIYLDDLWLLPLSILSEETIEGDTEIGDEESDVIVYTSEVTLPEEDEPITIYMLLYDDGTVAMTDEEESGTLYGEWTFEDETLTVSLTSHDEEEFDPPLELVFEYNEDDALVATDYPFEIFGQKELIFYAADDDSGEAEGEVYTYESEPLTIGDVEELVLALILNEDGSAMMSSDLEGEEPAFEYGEWERDDTGVVIVTFTEGEEGVHEEPIILTFEENEDDLSLLLVDESEEIFGDSELVLHRIE